jgi:predicted secreted protein
MKNDSNDRLEQLRFLTINYRFLQGYPIALVGLLNILQGIGVMIWGYPAVHLIYTWLFLVSLLPLVIAMNIAQNHYQRKFGIVKAPMEPRRARGMLAFAIIYVVLIVLGGTNFKRLQVALEPTLLNAALILVLFGLFPTSPWRHYAVIGLLLAAIAFLPAFHVVPVEQLWHGWSFMAAGIAFLLCGAIDRLIFTRRLSALPVEEIHA